jgi:hypothetical protein
LYKLTAFFVFGQLSLFSTVNTVILVIAKFIPKVHLSGGYLQTILEADEMALLTALEMVFDL